MKLFEINVDTPIGPMKLHGTDQHIKRCYWPDHPVLANTDEAEPGWGSEARAQLKNYFSGRAKTFSLPLEPEGTEFQQRVWSALLEMPFGKVSSYARFSADFQLSSHARPVGAAIGANPLLLLIPCHRVRGGDGSLTGYAGGLDRKEWLLQHEGVLQEQLRLF